MLKVALFDLDAALLRFSNVAWASFAAYLSECSGKSWDGHRVVEQIEPIWREYYLRIVRLELNRRNEAAYWKQMAKEVTKTLGVDCNIRKLLTDWPHYRFVEPQPGAHTLLTRLKLMGYKTAVYANTPPSLRTCLEYHGFGRLIDKAYACNDVGYVKPDGRGYRRVTELLGAEPQEIAYFDDDEYNIRTARGVGYRAYLVRMGQPGPEIVSDHEQIFEILRR